MEDSRWQTAPLPRQEFRGATMTYLPGTEVMCHVYHHYHLVPLIPPQHEFASGNLKYFQLTNHRFVERLSGGLHPIHNYRMFLQ